MLKLKFRSLCGLVGVVASALAITAGVVPVGASTQSQIAKARAELSAEEAFPTKIAETAPLKTSPPKGKTVIFLQGDESQLAFQGYGIAAAAKAIGWNYKVLDWSNTNPATFVTAMNEALQYHPVAVYFSGEPYSVWKSLVPAYQAAHVLIIPSSEAEQPLNKVVVASIGGLNDIVSSAKTLANYMTVMANGKNANILFVNIPAFPPGHPMQQAFSSDLEKGCSNCKVSTLDLTVQQLYANQVVPSVVSTLQKDASIHYIVSLSGAFINGLTPALKAAGLNGPYTIASAYGTAANEANVKSGVEGMTVSSGGFQEGGWLDIDTTLRWLEHMPITVTNLANGGWLPVALVKSNVGTPNNDLNVPANYMQQYLKLWKVS